MSAPVQLIKTTKQLQSCISRLYLCDEFAIDLEFDKNFYRFGFNMCLVQIFDGANCYLIDPLSRGLIIDKLFPVLEDERIQKVCFSFDEDLRLLHSLGCFPKNLYDLDIASRLLNYPAQSLENLLHQVLGVDTGTSSQQSNWYKRPLSEKQKRYAANDVLHLLGLKQVLANEAGKKGVSRWIREENGALDVLDYSNVNSNGIIKEKDKRGLNEVEWHLFKKMLNWRHKLARKFNKPDFQIAGKKLLLNLAKNPDSASNWQQIKGIFRKAKTEIYERELTTLLDEAMKEAEQHSLSFDAPAMKPLSDVEYRAMRLEKKKINRMKKSFFQPVKKRIEDEYGEEMASFILSNRIIEEMVTGNNSQLKNYKKELILKYAGELGLDQEVVEEFVELAG
jgi:ribonuclease D